MTAPFKADFLSQQTDLSREESKHLLELSKARVEISGREATTRLVYDLAIAAYRTGRSKSVPPSMMLDDGEFVESTLRRYGPRMKSVAGEDETNDVG